MTSWKDCIIVFFKQCGHMHYTFAQVEIKGVQTHPEVPNVGLIAFDGPCEPCFNRGETTPLDDATLFALSSEINRCGRFSRTVDPLVSHLKAKGAFSSGFDITKFEETPLESTGLTSLQMHFMYGFGRGRLDQFADSLASKEILKLHEAKLEELGSVIRLNHESRTKPGTIAAARFQKAQEDNERYRGMVVGRLLGNAIEKTAIFEPAGSLPGDERLFWERIFEEETSAWGKRGRFQGKVRSGSGAQG